MSDSSSEDDDYPLTNPSVNLNISNDQYYHHNKPSPIRTLPIPKEPSPPSKVEKTFTLKTSHNNDLSSELDIPIYGSKTIRHSLPAYDLWRPFYPTYLSEEKFQNFHRPKLRHYRLGRQALYRRRGPRGPLVASDKMFPIKNLSKKVYSFQKRLRARIIKAINSGLSREEIINRFLLIKHAQDLTAKQGELFLFEYSEQYPPVLSQIGMAVNVKNIIKPTHQLNRKIVNKASSTLAQNQTSENKNVNEPTREVDSGSFDGSKRARLGNYRIGYDEIVSEKLTRTKIYFDEIRPGSNLQVIENNLYRAPIFKHDFPTSDFLVVRTRNSFYIRSIQTIFTVGQTMPLIAIPQPTQGAITKFRTDISNNYIHRLFKASPTNPPTLEFEDLLKLFPDYSKLSLKRRLQCNGAKFDDDLFFKGSSKYGTLSYRELRKLFTAEQYCLNMTMLAARERLRELNYTESMINPTNAVKQETEVLAAPWNTSKAVLGTMSGRCYLDLKAHLIDPSGSKKEGFSCVAWSKSPTEDNQIKERQNGSSNVSKTSNQGPIQMINPLASKIRREKLERLAIYQKEAHFISSTQSNVLSSKEVLSSEEDEEEEEDIDDENSLDASFDEQLQDLSRMVLGGQTAREVSHEKEEEERRQMLREFRPSQEENIGNSRKEQQVSPVKSPGCPVNIKEFKNKILRITRTYATPDGIIHRTEIVREPKIIALYVQQKDATTGSSGQVSGRNQMESTANLQQRFESLNTSDSSKSERRASYTLGPSELCRADGMRITISKKVLDPKALRADRRLSRTCQKF